MADSTTTDQVEHELISTSLDVEQLDTNLFRSKSLWLPMRARGVFGGQVISQAIVSATNCVDPAYGLHSLHCYFLLSASPSLPVLYYVDRLRNGRSYATRFVRAVQKGRAVFIMMCSFHKPEPEHPFHQWQIPSNVPKPSEVEIDYDFYIRMRQLSETSERAKKILDGIIQERKKSSIQCTVQIEREVGDGTTMFMHYMRARGIPKYEPAYQKCILGYMSDLAFIGVGAKTLGLRRFGEGASGASALGMSSSLDHSIFYYSDDFDCSDWILHVIKSPRTGSGRGVVQGQMYASDGTLVAITTQEGVIRSGITGPERPRETKAKL
ncbi:Thioesterase/thiol ester dehydrase-isomerase [Fomitiporia mediterranea MF3/22]|uniref:Thioesterase/thiol ester dehydrase-isomerase n=1 Tax=Fomitiporia mediterranea (strain MF3/22) TaxID=694068 RepID=UPI0004407D13|nr:Thioesterase/thiol ester dehydrase-isomerase [Fomitiporia mediterranea MF3/22]EJD04105.1 Thioesterase/thiol ester dehydrase-isomerase [Fomitiporia mediterranea MF3/22]